MEDVQNHPAGVPLAIDRVGVRNLHIPLRVCERTSAKNLQHTVALVDLSVDLPAAFKGTHMSRFVEAISAWTAEVDALSYNGMKALLCDMRRRLDARRAQIAFHFPFFINKSAPATGIPSLLSYACVLKGELQDTTDNPKIFLEVSVPVMTVCPCSKAISVEGAHSQRAEIRMTVEMCGRLWIEDLVDMAEQSASSPVYTLLKRADEKFVTEQAFATPTFVEDVVRNTAAKLATHPQIITFNVEVESFESIHNHNAFASIAGHGLAQS